MVVLGVSFLFSPLSGLLGARGASFLAAVLGFFGSTFFFPHFSLGV